MKNCHSLNHSFHLQVLHIFSCESDSRIANVCLSVCPSVTKTYLPFRIMPISPYLHLPSFSNHAYLISAIVPISPPPLSLMPWPSCFYQPSYPSAIMPISHHELSFAYYSQALILLPT